MNVNFILIKVSVTDILAKTWAQTKISTSLELHVYSTQTCKKHYSV